MIFKPQLYTIPDEKSVPFIDPGEIRSILGSAQSHSDPEVQHIVNRSLDRNRLSLEETASLLNANDKVFEDIIFPAAEKLKKEIYGERIVLFAPLYIGNKCINHCRYCGFRATNRSAIRRTLEPDEVRSEVQALQSTGQKRLILVWGEHTDYSPQNIADTVRTVYSATSGAEKINRVNINAAPLDTEGFRTVSESGIGTYQIFQETYDPEVYSRFHPSGPKSDYNFRLTAMDRAMDAGIDDVGLGVLFGLGDWKFEVMALVRHTNHLESCYGVGPHTISFPRVRNASGVTAKLSNEVSDSDFKKIIAVLRLAVPYTGLILTAREPDNLRDSLIRYGISQIDAGTNLEIGGYTAGRDRQALDREQFLQMDTRTLAQTIDSLLDGGYIPSFCTACYRNGRTGEHFMEFSTKGFIKRLCQPNAIYTFAEYLCDYAGPELYDKGWKVIRQKALSTGDRQLIDNLDRIKKGERDLLI